MAKIMLVLVTLTLAGCATSFLETSDAQTQKVYRTGSNLPARDGSSDVKTLDPTTLQNRQPASVPSR